MDGKDLIRPAEEDELVIIYSTLPDEASARRIAEALVEAGLVACVNIHPPMTSLYEWGGQLETVSEVATFIKTRRALMDAVIAKARALHPYDTPCFLVLPVESANPDYLAWTVRQTKARVATDET